MKIMTKPILTTPELKELAMSIFKANVHETDPEKCWLFGGVKKSHYPRIYIDGRSRTAHRVVFELFHGPVPEDKPFVLHACDNKWCINPNHLRCGTRSDNAFDMRFNNKPLKLSERDEKVIKYMIDLGYTYQEIAEKFNCSYCKVRDVYMGNNVHNEFPDRYTPRFQ